MRTKTLTGRKSPPFVVKPQAITGCFNTLWMLLEQHGPHPKRVQPYGGALPSLHLPPSSFAAAYLFAECFSKLDDGKPNPSKEATTWERFYAAEEQCRLTNERLRSDRSSRTFFRMGSAQQILWSAAQKISAILGPFKWDDAAKYFGWGPGASTRLPRRRSHGAYKYSGRPDSTIGNAILANACIMRSALWQESLTFETGAGYVNIVPGNRIITVPKNYKTDRTIAIEPDMNMYVQKGIGGLMRRRLKRVGIDLDDQTRNQRLARVGSLSGLLATIDMSMASDTVSYEIVRQLLPADWFEALEQCRSPVGVLPSGQQIRYQKFSSMGNGYTFELETVIFYGLALAVLEDQKEKDLRVAVYGDDVIVPSAVVPKFMDILTYAGFTPNTKKTHVQGPFRESCGKHYISGHEVTPFYVKRVPRTLRDLFLLHNQIYRWFSRMQWNGDWDRVSGQELISRLRNLAPVRWRRPRIPDGFGDGAFIGTFDEALPRVAPHSLEGFTVQLMADVTESQAEESIGYLIHSLTANLGSTWYEPSSHSVGDAWGGVPLSSRTRVVTTLVPRFPGLDPFSPFPVN